MGFVFLILGHFNQLHAQYKASVARARKGRVSEGGVWETSIHVCRAIVLLLAVAGDNPDECPGADEKFMGC